MKKLLIVYYSHTGSNRFIADKLANDINAEKAEIHPRASQFLIQLIFSQLKISLGIRKLNLNLSKYDKIVLIGPIWTGKLIAPLRSFLSSYDNEINKLYFLTCCGSKDEDRDGKWGYTQVFDHVKSLIGSKCINCTALPITLVVPAEKLEDEEYILKTRLEENNWNAEIEQRYQGFVEIVKSIKPMYQTQ